MKDIKELDRTGRWNPTFHVSLEHSFKVTDTNLSVIKELVFQYPSPYLHG